MYPNPTDAFKEMRDIDPDAYPAASYNGAAIDTQGFTYATFLVQVGTMGASATLDFQVQEADSSGGPFSSISGTAITQLTQAGGDSDSVVKVVVRCEGQKRYLRGNMVVAVAACDAGSVCLLSGAKERPVA